MLCCLVWSGQEGSEEHVGRGRPGLAGCCGVLAGHILTHDGFLNLWHCAVATTAPEPTFSLVLKERTGLFPFYLKALNLTGTDADTGTLRVLDCMRCG